MKVVLLSNLPEIMSYRDMVKNGLLTEEELVDMLSDLFPINLENMVGSVDELLEKANTKYLRSEDFPNVIWIYSNNSNIPAQIEFVDVDDSKKWHIEIENNIEKIVYEN